MCSVNNETIYQIHDDKNYTSNDLYVAYKYGLEVVFRGVPTAIIAVLNLFILYSYHKVVKKRRNMIGRASANKRKLYMEERRMFLLLITTSALYVVCITPMAVLAVANKDIHLGHINFQIFRSTANSLETAAFSATFYIYCMFVKDFRKAFFETFGIASLLGKRKRSCNISDCDVSPTDGASAAVSPQFNQIPSIAYHDSK